MNLDSKVMPDWGTSFDGGGLCCRRSEMKTWEILLFSRYWLGCDRVLKV